MVLAVSYTVQGKKGVQHDSVPWPDEKLPSWEVITNILSDRERKRASQGSLPLDNPPPMVHVSAIKETSGHIVPYEAVLRNLGITADEAERMVLFEKKKETRKPGRPPKGGPPKTMPEEEEVVVEESLEDI